MTESFAIDSENHNAFSHWVFESLINVLDLSRACRIVVNPGRDYKHKLLKHLGWTDDHILFNDPSAMPWPTLSLNRLTIATSDFQQRYTRLFELLRCNAKGPPIKLLYLPRARSQNYEPNDRVNLSDAELRQWVIQHGGEVVDVLELPDWETQAQKVAQAECLIVDYGSALWVNGLLMSPGMKLIVLGNLFQHLDYPAMATLWQDISNRTGGRMHVILPTQSGRALCFDLFDVEKAYEEV